MDVVSQSPVRLLIAEPDAALRSALYGRLQTGRYRPTTVAAADACLQYLSAPPAYDLLMLGLSGPTPDLLRAAREQTPPGAILRLVDGTPLDETAPAARRTLGDFIVKPFSPTSWRHEWRPY
jgi:DNA-binding NtrC family response regulator